MFIFLSTEMTIPEKILLTMQWHTMWKHFSVQDSRYPLEHYVFEDSQAASAYLAEEWSINRKPGVGHR